MMKKDFGKLIDVYIEHSQKTGMRVDIGMIADLRAHLADKLGALLSEYLYAFYVGWEMRPEERQRLAAGWKLLGSYIERLVRPAGS